MIDMKAEKKEINLQIGKRLQTARENNGYTQETFAEILEISVEHYRKIENGVYGLQPEKMLILYRMFKIDPTYLVTGDKGCSFDIEMFLAKCSRKERDDFFDHMLAHIGKLIKLPQ
jgi:transcriptional regulator with XRE-family HTH domain